MKDSDIRAASNKKPRSLSRIVEIQVRERILSQELVAGAVVRPEDVGKKLGVSQTPAREALQTLKAQGFLVSEPGIGFVVAPLTSQDIEDIFTAHALLAGEIASRAVHNAQPESTEELEALHFELLAASKRRAWEQVEDRNHAFHRYITHLANSPKLSHVLLIISQYIPRSFYSSVGGWVDASVHDHEGILQSFRDKDPEKARETMHQHMLNAGALLARNFDRQSDSDS